MFSGNRLMSRALAIGAVGVLVLTACGDDDPAVTASPADSDKATVAITEPADGAALFGTVALKMTAEGVTIEPAGAINEGAGHFHVIADKGCVAAGSPIPRNADHVHLGAGQSEAKIHLGPGSHELCLQVGDGAHIAKDITDTVKVDVGITDRSGWCAVAGEVDELFSATDSGGADFAVRQVAYEGVRRLITQMSTAINQVDEASRADVTAALDIGRTIASAFIEATDAAGAEAALMAKFGPQGVQNNGPGATWILDNCNVDIDG